MKIFFTISVYETDINNDMLAACILIGKYKYTDSVVWGGIRNGCILALTDRFKCLCSGKQ